MHVLTRPVRSNYGSPLAQNQSKVWAAGAGSSTTRFLRRYEQREILHQQPTEASICPGLKSDAEKAHELNSDATASSVHGDCPSDCPLLITWADQLETQGPAFGIVPSALTISDRPRLQRVAALLKPSTPVAGELNGLGSSGTNSV